MPELNRWNDRIAIPDGHPVPFKAMLDAAKICFPTCNVASQALRDGEPFEMRVVEALRSLAYAIEQSADFQVSEYFADGGLYELVRVLKDRCETLAAQVAGLLEREMAAVDIGADRLT